MALLPHAQVTAALRSGVSRVRTVGLTHSARAWHLVRWAAELDRRLVCVTADDDAARSLAEDIAFYAGTAKSEVLHIRDDEALPWDELGSPSSVEQERMAALFHLAHHRHYVAVVVSVRALARRVLPLEVMRTLSKRVRVGDEVGRDALARALVAMGYRSSPLVEDPGTFSMRGDLLDVFPLQLALPVRIDFFGDTVESIRSFESASQRTTAQIDDVALPPARALFFSADTKRHLEQSIRDQAELHPIPTARVREVLAQVKDEISTAGLEGMLPGLFESGLGTLFEYLWHWNATPLVWLDQPQGQARELQALTDEAERSWRHASERLELSLPPSAHFVPEATVRAELEQHPHIEGGGLSFDDPTAPPIAFRIEPTSPLREKIRGHHGEEGALAPLKEAIDAWHSRRLSTVVACGSRGELSRLGALLDARGIKFVAHRQPFAQPLPPSGSVHLYEGYLDSGFVEEAESVAIISADDIFGPKTRGPAKAPRSASRLARRFLELAQGDLCVHSDFGICRYDGLVRLEIRGLSSEFLLLAFAGTDRVYLPVGRMRLVSKYTGGEGVALDRLGDKGFEKRKASVKEQLLKMAAAQVQLYARRKAQPGFAFVREDAYFQQFEADFEFEETPDQERAIDEVLADMRRPTPMDRLVVGDVGYGKTEVAMRAAFLAVQSKKQVAVLVPTTLLAHQHHATFTKRFAGYPVMVEVASSLRSRKQLTEVFGRARAGTLDILIGTHQLLNPEVGFADLGLLVLDEEQKFGVRQKEAIAKLKTSVDVLTLSATPIPRTLNMALSGMRELSLIATPPADRKSIRTFVNKFDPAQVKDAILREVGRGGQVYFVHNRVRSLASMERFLRGLVPSVRIVVAHGQMAEGTLERVMVDFVERRAQLLLATSIIESGLDIPNANTLIVNRADRFGLAQLYQLRGRVGRSRERAYAYLLAPQGRAMTRDAERRLEVLQSFTELGAGFAVASHDLEIRGAGSVLGKAQSGNVEAVGFELYTELLEEAVAQARGETVEPDIEPDVNIHLAALLPEAYVPDVRLRLSLYKRLSELRSGDEVAEFRVELIDRFGDLPREAEALLDVASLKLVLRHAHILRLDVGQNRLSFTFTTSPSARQLAAVAHSKRMTSPVKLAVRIAASDDGLGAMREAQSVAQALARAA